ncbi:MAG TPA: hypothetical protein PLE45_02635, partial [Spirochaetota bacterium]|nr:hypothetical protein [Spirochaetota bacterium]
MSRKLFYLSFILISILILVLGCDQNPFFGMGEEVDTKPPTFKITSHINGDFVASNFTIEGTCSDNVGVTKITAKETSGSTIWNATIINKTSFRINITGLTEGEKTFDLYAYDAKGNSAYTKLYVIVDTGLPTVTVTEPALKSLSFFEPTLPDKNDFDNLKYFMNGTFKIKGYVDDKFIIKKTTLKLAKSTDLSTDVLTITIEKDKPLPPEAEENSFPTKWTFNIDSTKLTDKTAYLVKIETQDQAGNKNVTQSLGYIYVDQDMDNPNGKINSPSDITFPQSVASGTLWDDDGLSKIYWYVGKTSLGDPTDDVTQWGDATSDDFAAGVIDLSGTKPNITSWNFTTPTGTGEYKMYICPVDING